MSYHPRIESKTLGTFLTTRCRGSELWFINNPALESAILGYAAKYAERYDVALYALAIEGNHIQIPAHFPGANRAAFMRDFNSNVAKAVDRLTPEYPGGRLWARRYSGEILPGNEDVEEYFWYTVLQPIQDGLVEKLSDYPGYNSFHDAVNGIEREFSVVRRGEYNAAKRYKRTISVLDYTDTVRLKYRRLPGYEAMSQEEYARMMYRKLEDRVARIVETRRKEGKGFAGKAALRRTPRGSKPISTKTSTYQSHRPRVLCVDPDRRAEWIDWYFEQYFAYKECSKRYRAGESTVIFPPGTYPPWRPAIIGVEDAILE